ncbi:Phage terminase large subunit [compost metagenome]
MGRQRKAARLQVGPRQPCVKEFEEALDALARGDSGPMQLFVNETLGETWEVVGERTDEYALQSRAEDYPLKTVPAGGLILTAGVDVQRDRWEIDVWAWGRGLESWHVDHHVIHGNPASEDDWAPVTAYLSSRYVQAWHGGSMGLSAISIDSSDQTQAVYNWVRKTQHQLPRLRAIKGRSEQAKAAGFADADIYSPIALN